jgi:hypothetical protein
MEHSTLTPPNSVLSLGPHEHPLPYSQSRAVQRAYYAYRVQNYYGSAWLQMFHFIFPMRSILARCTRNVPSLLSEITCAVAAET